MIIIEHPKREDFAMDPVLAIAIWAAIFIGSHLIISSKAVRPRLISVVGEGPYAGIYSLVALATFVPLVIAFAYHKHSGPMLWNLRDVPPVRWLVWALMLVAFVIFVASFITPNPGSIGGEASGADPGAARGVLKISRHPSFVAFTMFGCGHVLMNGFVGDLIFFGTFPALSIIGGMHQDARKKAQLGDAYRHLVASTSFVPGVALLRGRQHWSAKDMPWIAILIGLALTGIILWLHPTIFGGNPLG
jgi:uncharacterized membrane protein